MSDTFDVLQGLLHPPLPPPPPQPDPGTTAFLLPVSHIHDFFEHSPPDAQYRAYVYLTPMNESAVGWITQWWRDVYDHFYVPWIAPIVPWYAGHATSTR